MIPYFSFQQTRPCVTPIQSLKKIEGDHENPLRETPPLWGDGPRDPPPPCLRPLYVINVEYKKFFSDLKYKITIMLVKPIKYINGVCL